MTDPSSTLLNPPSFSASKQPRVSILASDLSGSGAGRWGGGVRPFLLAQALRKAGYTPEIVGFSREPNPGTVQSDIPTTVIPLRDGASLWRSANALLNALSGDVVYAYKLRLTSFGLALLHRVRSRKPVLLDIDDWELSWHGGDRWQYQPTPLKVARDLLKPGGALRNPEHPLYLKWIQQQTHRANAITTHNQFLMDRFGGTYLPSGKDTELFDPSRYNPEESRAELGLSQYRVLMFPGAPRPYKGVEDILAALDLLDEPDLRLVIVGGSPYDEYDTTLKQKWGDRLIHLPKTSYQQMPKVVSAAHVIVVPQRNDPATQAQFPLKLTDGMAMAKPILATRVGDIPNILSGTGYLVEPDSPEQLAAGIQSIFNNYDHALRLGQKAHQRCLEHYSIETMANILKNLLQSFLE